MGYDFHITRKRVWCDRDGPAVSAEEWLRLVDADPELRLDPENPPYYVLWSGPSENPEPWLDWANGEIFTHIPDPSLIRKMVEIGARLGAKVQGGDGEAYDGRSESDEEPSGFTTRRAWREFLTGLLLQGAVLVTLSAAVLAAALWLSS